MFESISSATPSRIAPTEWLLARIAGPDRAAAILGDLLEISVTRGRPWFWAAYTRTLISLGWRTPVAFLCAIASMRFLWRIVPWLEDHTGFNLMDAGLFGVYNRHVRLFSWNVAFALVLAQFLLFALPFVVLRFGLRNRLTQLTCALFLIAVPVYCLRPWFMDMSSLLTVGAIAAALHFPHWRRPLIVLAGMGITAASFKVACFIFLASVYRNHFHLSHSQVAVCDTTAFAVAAIVCSRLHGWLLEHPSLPNETIA